MLYFFQSTRRKVLLFDKWGWETHGNLTRGNLAHSLGCQTGMQPRMYHKTLVSLTCGAEMWRMICCVFLAGDFPLYDICIT